MKAWHFTNKTLRDGRPLPPNGEILRHEGKIEICKSGLHASTRLIDTLRYAPGGTICRVECTDIMDKHKDKLVCRERTILWRIDGDAVLRRFARKCALDVAHLWIMPDIVRKYLKTGDESLRAAAGAAALEAARDAAWEAAWEAAWAAAGAASRNAVGNAAWAAARSKQNRRLTAMVIHEHKRGNKWKREFLEGK